MTPHLRRSAVCATAMAVIAACSGGDTPAAEPVDDSVATTTTAAPPDEVPAPTTTQLTTTTSTSAAPMDDDVGEYEEWCGLSRQAEELTEEAQGLFRSGPDGVREYLERIAELIEQADPVVPEQLADAWAVSVQMSETVREAIEAADYDILLADLSAAEELAEVDAEASDTLDAFNAEFCGIEPDPTSDDDGGFDPSLGTLRDQFIDSLVAGGFSLAEAECVFEAYDFSATDTIGERAAIEAALEACEISPERVSDLVDGTSG